MPDKGSLFERTRSAKILYNSLWRYGCLITSVNFNVMEYRCSVRGLRCKFSSENKNPFKNQNSLNLLQSLFQ